MLIFLITGYFFIGLHQLFEYLAIAFENEIIYKSGLILSISAMYFNLKASEYLLNQSIGSKIVLGILFFLSIYIFTTPMYFENMHFYVRGKENIYWGATWMVLFLYWNLVHFFTYLKSDNRNFQKVTLLLPTFSLNISFLLAAIYCYSISVYKKIYILKNSEITCSPLLSNFEVVFDAPSIWCVFATIQGYFIYKYSSKILSLDYSIDFNVGSIKLKYCALIALLISLLILFTLPLFSALSIKMILK